MNDKLWNPKTQLKRVANLRFKTKNQGMAVLILHFLKPSLVYPIPPIIKNASAASPSAPCVMVVVGKTQHVLHSGGQPGAHPAMGIWYTSRTYDIQYLKMMIYQRILGIHDFWAHHDKKLNYTDLFFLMGRFIELFLFLFAVLFLYCSLLLCLVLLFVEGVFDA